MAKANVSPSGWHRHTVQHGTCAVCCEGFSRRRRGPSDGFYCCSRPCGDVLRRWQKEKQRRVTIAKRDFARWADPCRAIGYSTEIARLRKRLARKHRPCATCGQPTGCSDLGGLRLYCSEQCKPVNEENVRRHRKIAKAKRRARKRGVGCESVDPIKVFMRDGWRCHLCGGMTDKNRRGTNHPKAPQLDHIIPLSKGGPHSYANTACSHRECNIAKADKIIGQPSLLAA